MDKGCIKQYGELDRHYLDSMVDIMQPQTPILLISDLVRANTSRE